MVPLIMVERVLTNWAANLAEHLTGQHADQHRDQHATIAELKTYYSSWLNRLMEECVVNSLLSEVQKHFLSLAPGDNMAWDAVPSLVKDHEQTWVHLGHSAPGPA